MTEQERTTRRLYELSRSVRECIFETTFGEPSDEVSVKLDRFLELEEDGSDAWVGENIVKAFGQKPKHWYFLVSERIYLQPRLSVEAVDPFGVAEAAGRSGRCIRVSHVWVGPDENQAAGAHDGRYDQLGERRTNGGRGRR